MKIINTQKGIEIKIYSSGSELPIDRYMQFQKYLILESSIGSDVTKINERYQRISAFIQEGKLEDALRENENALIAIRTALSGVHYTSMAFACLCKEVGKECAEDISEEGLQRTVELIQASGITAGDLDSAVEEIKKKSD